jgi:hypothetical protein
MIYTLAKPDICSVTTRSMIKSKTCAGVKVGYISLAGSLNNNRVHAYNTATLELSNLHCSGLLRSNLPRTKIQANLVTPLQCLTCLGLASLVPRLFDSCDVQELRILLETPRAWAATSASLMLRRLCSSSLRSTKCLVLLSLLKRRTII